MFEGMPVVANIRSHQIEHSTNILLQSTHSLQLADHLFLLDYVLSLLPELLKPFFKLFCLQ